MLRLKPNVQRFIPSDYSSDFTNWKEGQNRNLDFRRKFHEYLDKTPLKQQQLFLMVLGFIN
jgi:hypothetical protein